MNEADEYKVVEKFVTDIMDLSDVEKGMLLGFIEGLRVRIRNDEGEVTQ